MNTAKQKIVNGTVFAGLIVVSMVMPVVAANLSHSQSAPHAVSATPSSQPAQR